MPEKAFTAFYGASTNKVHIGVHTPKSSSGFPSALMYYAPLPIAHTSNQHIWGDICSCRDGHEDFAAATFVFDGCGGGQPRRRRRAEEITKPFDLRLGYSITVKNRYRDGTGGLDENGRVTPGGVVKRGSAERHIYIVA